MANTDSFIDEVSEEVRRDRLFALFRRWGWVAVLAVLGIVGGAAYLEYAKARDQATAQAFGDALLGALDGDTPEARIDALQGIEAGSPEAQVILALLAAAEAAQAEDPAEAADRLRAAAAAPGLARRYADLALLKAEMLSPAPEAEARQVLEALAEPGAPYAGLAEEQLALLDARLGNIDAALDRLRSIERSAAATAGLQQRAGQLIVALESGAVLVDTSPEPEVAEEAVPEEEAAPEDAAAPVDEAAPEDDLVPVEEDSAPTEDAAPAEAADPAADE